MKVSAKRLIVVCALNVLATVVGIAGCAGPAPDLNRLYAMQSNPGIQPPVVLIPGALGSRLSDAETGREIWPGPFWKLLFNDYDGLALEIDPETLEPRADRLVVSGLTDTAAGRDFYAEIQRVLERYGGYRRAEPGESGGLAAKQYYVFTYDWRQDNVETVRLLDVFLKQIRQDYDDPHLKVDVIGHSMGGLIARYYGRYGTDDVLNDNEFPVTNRGARHMRRVILLGTPNLGTVKAFETLMAGLRVGLNRIPEDVVATFPSTYQLLPHPLNTWLVDPGGEALDHDVFASEFWDSFGMSVFDEEVRETIGAGMEDAEAVAEKLRTWEAYFDKHIERARRFVWSLTVPEPEPTVRFITFGGDCTPTPARILVEKSGETSAFRFRPEEISQPQKGIDYGRLLLEPGDGVVTKPSLLAKQTLDPTVSRHRYIYFPLDYSFFLCVEHDRLAGNIHFQNNLLHVLLSADGAEVGQPRQETPR